MIIPRSFRVLTLVTLLSCVHAVRADAQSCFSDLFAGCASCFRRAPAAYAVAPVAAPMVTAPQPYAVAPVPAPPPPVVVPVQQVSYVPETTYRTQYQCVPVTTYKPSSEIDPCTGCPRECMQQVTQYVQQAVNVPVTQYRAVYSTKYVQMQAGMNPAAIQPAMQPGLYAQPVPGMIPAATVAPGPAGAAVSPFTAPLQTTPQAWGSAGADIPQQLISGQSSIAAPRLSPPGVTTQPAVPQPTFQQQIVPQSGAYTQSPIGPTPQPTSPPALTPTPALRPIPEIKGAVPNTEAPGAASGTGNGTTGAIDNARSGNSPDMTAPKAPPAGGIGTGAVMPTLQGTGPAANTGAFPRLLEPTGHTTSWKPLEPPSGRSPSYPQTALPSRLALGPARP
ncbi:MAG: hypothetical protein ACKOCW_08560 [Planctomycetaceae bacterium]